LGGWLAWFMLLSGNLPQVMARTDLGFGLIALLLAVGHAGAARLAAGASAHPTLIPGVSVLAAVSLLAAFPLWNGWPGGPIWIVLAAAGADLLLIACVWPTASPPVRASAANTAMLCATSLMAFLGLGYIA